jgi:hypothetical protein
MLRLEYAGGLHARWRLKYAGFMMQKYIVRLFDFMRYVYMPAQISVRCSFGPLGIMATKSDSGKSARSRRKSDSGRSARSSRSAKLKGQAVEKKDEEKPTVAADASEPLSLATVRLCISMY